MPKELNGYLAIVLDEKSHNKLKQMAIHPKVHAHHLTIAFKPTEKVYKKYEAVLGRTISIPVSGIAEDERGQAILAKETPTENKFPHITISCTKNVPPKYSNELLANTAKNNQLKPLDIKLSGRVEFVEF